MSFGDLHRVFRPAYPDARVPDIVSVENIQVYRLCLWKTLRENKATLPIVARIGAKQAGYVASCLHARSRNRRALNKLMRACRGGSARRLHALRNDEPHWVTSDDAIVFATAATAETGEPFSIINPAGLDSALARPRQLFAYGKSIDVLDMALSLMFGIAQNHPFQQANKRTALLCAVLFLERNGYVLDMPDDERLAERIIAVISGELSEPDFRTWLETYVHAMS